MNGIQINFEEGTKSSLTFNSIKKCCDYFSEILNIKVRHNNILHCCADANFAKSYLNEPHFLECKIFKNNSLPKKWHCKICNIEVLNSSKNNHRKSKKHLDGWKFFLDKI